MYYDVIKYIRPFNTLKITDECIYSYLSCKMKNVVYDYLIQIIALSSKTFLTDKKRKDMLIYFIHFMY